MAILAQASCQPPTPLLAARQVGWLIFRPAMALVTELRREAFADCFQQYMGSRPRSVDSQDHPSSHGLGRLATVLSSTGIPA